LERFINITVDNHIILAYPKKEIRKYIWISEIEELEVGSTPKMFFMRKAISVNLIKQVNEKTKDNISPYSQARCFYCQLMPPRIEKNDFFISPLFAILKLLRQENIMYSYANLLRLLKQVLMKTWGVGAGRW